MFQRWILHIDLDAFFVEVERLLNPELRGKPVIVGGTPDGRGVVASASYEARARGVHSAMPSSRAKRLCPEAIFVSGNHAQYSKYSHLVRERMLEFTPAVEMASIDEAYLDLTGCERLHGSPITAADRLRARIKETVGLPCSCGLAANRMVAKIASDLAKPAGRLVVLPGMEQRFLAPLPLRSIPGIGPKTGEKLEAYGLKKIGDLAALGEETLERLLSDEGRHLYRRCIGWDETPVRAEHAPQKSISREQTFGEDIGDLEKLFEVLSYLSEKVADDLRKEGTTGRTITLKIRYADFKTETRARSLPTPTHDDRVIFSTARDILLASYKRRVRLRLLGINVSNLSGDQWQMDLLEKDRTEALDRLYSGLDKIRERYGFGSILRAESLDKEAPVQKIKQPKTKKSI